VFARARHHRPAHRHRAVRGWLAQEERMEIRAALATSVDQRRIDVEVA
jgi:hypothetical protein